MLIGALILLVGIAIGYAIALYAPRRDKPVAATEDPYDKYRNAEGLLTRRTITSREAPKKGG